MYLDFFGLTAKPFQITTDPKFLWLGEKHKEALATLHYGIQENRGFLLLTGEVGTGKTILVNRLISSLDSDTIVATLSDPDLKGLDFYRLLADGLKMHARFSSKGEFLIHFRKFLHQSHIHQKQVLLIIDESQRLNHRLLEDIRVLSNIELHDRKLINIFFVGQPEFNSILMITQNRALSQRITVRYNIEALDQQETCDYVNYRLRIAGSKKPIFKITALNEIFLYSGGIPRLINIVCDHALLTAFSNNLNQIDANMIRECAEELRIPAGQVQSSVATLGKGQTAPAEKDLADPPFDTESKTGDKALSDKNLDVQATISGSDMPLMRKLFYMVVILLLLVILGVVVRQQDGGHEPPHGNVRTAAEPHNTAVGKSESGNADQITQNQSMQSVQPPEAPEPISKSGNATITKTAKKIEVPENVAVPGKTRPSTASGSANDQKNSSQTEPPVHTSAAGNATITKTAKKIEVPENVAVPGKTRPSTASGSAIDQKNSGQTEPPVHTSTIDALPEIQTAPPVTAQIEPLQLLREKVVIPFDINSNDIDEGAYDALNRIALFLAAHSDQKILVRGYTDSSGSEGYNETVSNFRATAVKSYLIAKGVQPENIETYAMGAFNPVAPNETLAGRRKNRRVEIEFAENKDTTD